MKAVVIPAARFDPSPLWMIRKPFSRKIVASTFDVVVLPFVPVMKMTRPTFVRRSFKMPGYTFRAYAPGNELPFLPASLLAT